MSRICSLSVATYLTSTPSLALRKEKSVIKYLIPEVPGFPSRIVSGRNPAEFIASAKYSCASGCIFIFYYVKCNLCETYLNSDNFAATLLNKAFLFSPTE